MAPLVGRSLSHGEAALHRPSESYLGFNVVFGSQADIIASESEYNPSDLNSIESINTEAPVLKGEANI
jgi:hypothetical protein